MSEQSPRPATPPPGRRAVTLSDGAAWLRGDVLERFLAGAAAKGERSVTLTRLVVLALFLGRNVAADGFSKLAAGQPRELVIDSAILAGAALSFWIFRTVKADRWLQRRLLLSVGLDALLLTVILGAMVLWPVQPWRGILGVPEPGLYVVAAVASGARLSRRVALVGVGLLALSLCGIVALDLLRHAAAIEYGWPSMVDQAIIFVGGAVLGVLYSGRARTLVFDGAEATREAVKVRARLGAYVSEEVAAQAMEEEAPHLGGERRVVSVLFSDLRGFTTSAERLPPERLIAELNGYLDAVVPAIRAEGGVVDKYIGDAVMAVFGIPQARIDDAARAMRAALGMQAALALHNEERAARGLPPLVQGIGIHHGTVVLGNVGTSAHMQYTAVGDAVNVASRLEGSTKELGASVLVSGEAVAAARAVGAVVPALRSLGSVRIRGREQELEVFAIGG